MEHLNNIDPIRSRMARRDFVKASLLSAAAGTVQEAKAAQRPRFLGVTVLPEYIQSEGIDGVLKNLIDKVHANAVAISPYVMVETDRNAGKREPPADAGAGSVRLLDRPLWGKREIWVSTAPSFAPNMDLYGGLRYQPPPADDWTHRHGAIIHQFIEAARSAGLKVYMQVQAAIPPGYRVQFGGPVEEDQPRLPDGRVPARRLANNGSLASPHILDYQVALIRDLCRQYPAIHGFRFDWPEYPPYFLDDACLDFGLHAKNAAERLGFDFSAMRNAAGKLYRRLHGRLRDEDLVAWSERDQGRFQTLSWLRDYPALVDWLNFKAVLVEQLLRRFRSVINEEAGREMEMMPNAFPPPWTLASGLDFQRVAPQCTAISVKHYTMHWPMMLRFYADQLRAANPGLSDPLLVRCLVRLLDIADDDGLPSCDDYHYPEPDEPHPVGSGALARKLRQAQRAAGATPILGLVHGYGPLADFRRRLEVAWTSGRHGIWVNRYAYLDDRKLEIIGQIAR